MTSGYFYTLAGKTKLKVFEGEFEGELFSKSSALNKSPVTLPYEYLTYELPVFYQSIAFLTASRSSSYVSNAGSSGLSALICSVLLKRKPALLALIIARSL